MHRSIGNTLLFVIVGAALTASSTSAQAPNPRTVGRIVGRVVDAATVQLTHASASREALVRELLTALAASDTGRLSALTLTAREFADLVYPESPYTRPPMQQAPALVWAQITNASQTGFGRLVR
ncbi:MAG: hypothetical protein CK550_00345, partial [Gemmatimonadetes bacterium]